MHNLKKEASVQANRLQKSLNKKLNIPSIIKQHIINTTITQQKIKISTILYNLHNNYIDF